MLSPNVSRLLLGLPLLALSPSAFAQAPLAKPNMATPIKSEAVDPDSVAEWEDGKEKPIAPDPTQKKLPWERVLWTEQNNANGGLDFGSSKTPGIRHLRVGFKTAVPVGSILVRDGGSVSVLRADAPYPGDLSDDSIWTPAQRLEDGSPSRDEIASDGVTIWTLPPGTTTRAIRFTHNAEDTDKKYAGHLGGLFIFKDGFTNLAPLATTFANRNQNRAAKLVNEDQDSWSAWDNDANDNSPLITAENPAWVALSWPAPVKLSGLNLVWPGFNSVDVQIYTGPNDKHPRDASEGDWKTVKSFGPLALGYASQIWPTRLDFDQVVTTRAIRLKLTSATTNTHPHITGKILKGRRVWLGEVMALSPLDNAPIVAVKFPASSDEPKPPIPVKFNLKQPSFVTLVIDDPSGKRVRNLVSETYFPAGDNIAWWDGTDDLGRDVDAAKHGLYKIPAQFVAPGSYKVRGITRAALVPRYEFSVYNAGNPPWKTADSTGGWLTNHSAPQAALFLPADKAPGSKPLIYLGSYVSEGGSGLAWVNEDGQKQGGRGWVGGVWTAAPYLAADFGTKPAPDIYAYVASVWSVANSKTQLELRITGLSAAGDVAVQRYEFPKKGTSFESEIGGIAARDGIVVTSLTEQGQLVFTDVKTKAVSGTAPIDAPEGIAFDAQGRLLVISGTKVFRYDSGQLPLPAPKTLISAGLEAPNQIALAPKGNIYISDRGQSHQVKVFDSNGKFIRAIGKPGEPKAGPYDPLHMNNPAGMAIDSKNQLWVTENDRMPKRVSVWSLEGQLIKAYYGPAKYGGGGWLDSNDKTKFYYADESRGTMEFKLDWQKGEFQLTNVLYRKSDKNLKLADRQAAPETAFYLNGKRYFTNCFNSAPTGGSPVAFLFLDKGGILQPVAALGRAEDWDIFEADPYKPAPPADANPKKKTKIQRTFTWSDSNEDGQVQPSEVTFIDGSVAGITMQPDLSFLAAKAGDQTVRYVPTGFTANGVPRYDLTKGQVLATSVQGPASSGGCQALVTADGQSVVTLGAGPYSALSVTGGKNGQSTWSYPSLWPGLHASHRAPKANFPGELIGTTRLLGGFVTPKESDAGPLWAINSNLGMVYLFTADGMLVGTVFKDSREGKSWQMPRAERNQDLSDLTLNDEDFWPTISQSPAGEIYLVDGNRMALVRLDGINTLRRLPTTDLKITPDDLKKSQTYLVALETRRQKEQGSGILQANLEGPAPTVDGLLTDWKNAEFVDIDKSGKGGGFNSSGKAYDVTAAVSISGDRLYAAWQTADPKLLANTGEIPNAPFKTGGALDLMLATDPKADPNRANPVAGDLRLIVTQAKGKPMAVLYRAVVPGTRTPVPFSSPWRTITLDQVEDVSSQVQLAGKDGNYEISIPLATLGLKPQPGQAVQGDIGILRGDGNQTMARVYWSNKATGITADVPSEAVLTPQLWGKIEFKPTN